MKEELRGRLGQRKKARKKNGEQQVRKVSKRLRSANDCHRHHVALKALLWLGNQYVLLY